MRLLLCIHGSSITDVAMSSNEGFHIMHIFADRFGPWRPECAKSGCMQLEETTDTNKSPRRNVYMGTKQ